MSQMQQTSLEAYQNISPELGKRQQIVYETLKALSRANNMMLSKALQLPINSITPRVNELRKKGLVVEAYKELCPFTAKLTIFWRINSNVRTRDCLGGEKEI